MSQNYTDLNKDRSTRETSSDQIKRTDVNILLNRVRLDKKKNFSKKYINFFFFSWVNLLDIYLFNYLDHKSYLKVY